MARLTYVYRAEDISYVNIGRRQLPVVAGDNLMMLMDLNSKGLAIDSPHIRGKELEEFTRKFNLLTTDELHQSLEIDSATFVSVLNQCVQCVGCRRRVERLFYQLTLSGHATLDPLVLKSSCILSIAEEKLKSPQALGTLLYRHHEVLNNLLENKLRNKTRCVLHSLDTFRSKPFSETWREVWSSMKHNCRAELAVIETKELHEVLENYLKKHKFCQGCRTKIEKAYKILVGEMTSKERGFVAALYANIKKCHPDKHIHVFTNKIDFLDALIRRAEPEVNGSYSKQRERHAKTLEIAQEEVLTCVGMIMYERLRRIYVSLREEERACQVLAAVGVHALCRSFDMSVEQKQGISNLELLYQEISRAEKAKEHKREQKKLKKKKKKDEKKNSYRKCDAGSDTAEADEEAEEEEDEDEEEEQDEAVDVCDEDDDEEEEYDDVEKDTSLVEETEAHVAQQCGTQAHVVVATADVQAEEAVQRNAAQPPQQPQKKKKLQKQKQKQKQQPPKKKNKKRQQQQQALSSSSPTTRSSSCSAINTSSNTAASSLSSPIAHAVGVGNAVVKCNDCLSPARDCPCENDVKDSGYGSEPNSHGGNSLASSVIGSPDGSEVSCSDGFCNHDHGSSAEDEQSVQHCGNETCDSPLCQQHMQTLSLQQMLDDFDGSDEDDENCYIPQEVVLEYQYQRERVQQQRQQLRETLKQNFARLCMQQRGGLSFSSSTCK